MFNRNRSTAPTVIVADEAFAPERFEDSDTFGIDLSGASAELRADSKRATMRPGPAPRR